MIDYSFKVDNRHNLTWFYPKLCKYQSEMDPKKDRVFLGSKKMKISRYYCTYTFLYARTCAE